MGNQDYEVDFQTEDEGKETVEYKDLEGDDALTSLQSQMLLTHCDFCAVLQMSKW